MNTTNKLHNEITELYQTVKMLRSDKGWPWDKNQPPESLAQYLLQETYEVLESIDNNGENFCLLYTSPSPRDLSTSRMPSSA